jgi:hypothetical protein
VWGLCVPSGCSNQDLETGLIGSLMDFTGQSGLEFKVQIKEQSCYVKEPNWIQDLSRSSILAMYFLSHSGKFG